MSGNLSVVPSPNEFFDPILVEWTLKRSTEHFLHLRPDHQLGSLLRRLEVWEDMVLKDFETRLAELIDENEVPTNDVWTYATIDFSARRRLLRLMMRLWEKT